VRGRLERVRVPGADEARERARAVTLAAYAAREPLPRQGRRRVGIAVAVAAIAAGVAVASPPGRAVVDQVREVVGVERSAPALFSLPRGRILATSADGVWVVERDGKKRLLPGYRSASWSPFGRFVVTARRNELAALEPNGDVRWTLARPDVRFPRWTGTATDTRIAYVDRTGIRVVAGDGTADRLLAPAESGPLAWRPGAGHVLAYASASEVRVQDTDTGRVVVRANRGVDRRPIRAIEWSSDGRRLLVLDTRSVRVYGPRGQLLRTNEPADGGRNVDAAFQPGTHRILVARVHGGQSTVFDVASGRAVFNGTGVFDGITFAPDGRWLAIEWRTADQWVFVRATAPRAIRAVSGIAAQFRGTPEISGWCC
jgi:hypothetical protein